MPPPTTPTKSSALIKDKTCCILLKDVEVKVENPLGYLELKDKVFKLVKGSEVVTRGDPVPAVWTGSTEPLSINNASYRISATMNLLVYEPVTEEISHRLNLFRHSNLQPLDETIDTAKPFEKGTIVTVKKLVLDQAGEEKASPSDLLRIKSDWPFTPRTGMPVKGRSLPLTTACYTVEKVVKGKRDFKVLNFLRIMHADLKKLE